MLSKNDKKYLVKLYLRKYKIFEKERENAILREKLSAKRNETINEIERILNKVRNYFD